MLRYLYADQLDQFPRLADEMFTHRADQFKTRLGWDVSVDANGHERDEYDALNPLYVIWETADGGAWWLDPFFAHDRACDGE